MSKPGRRSARIKNPAEIPQNLTDYQHKQPGRTLVALISLPLVICLTAAISHPEHRGLLLLISTALIICLVLLSSLSIQVNANTLQWHFGPGLIRKQLALSEIGSVEMTRTTLLEGWGIHFTKRGWLYNVSGKDAVYIVQKDGKSLLLGTDDVVGLLEAIQNRIEE